MEDIKVTEKLIIENSKLLAEIKHLKNELKEKDKILKKMKKEKAFLVVDDVEKEYR